MNALLLILAIILLLIAAFFFSTRAMRKACRHIVDDLKRQKAIDPDSAIELPYCRRQMLRFGLRDYRPDALNFLVKNDFVRMAEGGRCYLGKELDGQGDGIFPPQA